MHVFTILAEPNRRLLLDLLLEGAEPVSRLVEQVDMSQPVVSKHLRILRDAGFVSVMVSDVCTASIQNLLKKSTHGYSRIVRYGLSDWTHWKITLVKLN